MSYDFKKDATTPTDLSDNLWTRYDEYSTKFDIAVLDDENTPDDSLILY